MHLFLDANVYLGFFKLAGDDLEELQKLVVAVRQGQTTLYVTEQVRDEYWRNREVVIDESLRNVEKARLPSGFPRLVQNYDEYQELRRALTLYEEQRGRLLKTVREAAKDGELHADRLIQELLELAYDVSASPELLAKAQRRVDRGNPPGKRASYGDAINWEVLLAAVPDHEDLLFVSGDADYESPLEPGRLMDFLRTEWRETKHSEATLYTNLTALFQAHYPDIRLAEELDKELAMAKLISSESFLQTHAAIREVEKYPEFTPEQAQALIRAANHNSQIYWIHDDDDVRDFFTRIALQYEHGLDLDDLEEFWATFSVGEDSSEG